MKYPSNVPVTQERALQLSFIATSAVFIVTAFHHFYGAAVYNTPWRRDVGVNGGVTLGVCFAFMYLYMRFRRKIFLHLYTAVSLLVFGLVIGLFEGLYNHILKDLLFFFHMPLSAWRNFFPAPTYEIPDNFIFESTGIIQFFVALAPVYYLIKVYKATRNTTEKLSA